MLPRFWFSVLVEIVRRLSGAAGQKVVYDRGLERLRLFMMGSMLGSRGHMSCLETVYIGRGSN